MPPFGNDEYSEPIVFPKQKYVVQGQFRNLFNDDAFQNKFYFMKWSGATENPGVLGALTLPFNCTLKKVSYAWQSGDDDPFELPEFSQGGDEPRFDITLALIDEDDDNAPSLITSADPIATIIEMTTENSGGYPHGVEDFDESFEEGQTIGVVGALSNVVATDLNDGADLLLVFVFEIDD